MENGEQPMQFLEVNENSNPDKQALKYTLKYQANPDTAIPSQLDPRYQVRKYNEEKEKPAFADSNNKSLVDISSSLVDDKLGVEMKFDPENPYSASWGAIKIIKNLVQGEDSSDDKNH